MKAAATSAPHPASAGRLRGLYAITPDEADSVILEAKVRAALAGGARIVQYRNKSTDKSLRRAQALALRALCRAAGATFIINDDLALALATDADGVHLGRDDGDIAAARQALGPARLLGASCYDRLDLAQRALELGADHIAFGSVFSSPTKPGAVRASLALFGQARRQWNAPLIAIGGITADNAREVVVAGADAIAVISALFDAPHIEARARQFATLFNSQTSTS